LKKFAIENERGFKRLLMMKNSPIFFYNKKKSICGTFGSPHITTTSNKQEFFQDLIIWNHSSSTNEGRKVFAC
jgi:hypothetical protein